MAIITYREALRQAIDEEMARDDSVLLIGEEVAQYNGAYKVSRGLWDKYGSKRVVDTPITEEGFTGLAVGAAMAGLRPIVEWMTLNFSIQALDQVINNAAKMRYMSGGQFSVPIVFRGPNGPAEWLGSQHSQSLGAIYAHVPGLKVVCAAGAYEAKGLLKTAIRDENPVVLLEGELMYGWKGDVPEEEYLLPLDKADIKRQGKDVTIVTYGEPVQRATEAAEKLQADGVEAEIVDMRSLRPVDKDTICGSVAKTGRCVVVDEAWPIASVGAYLGWLIAKECFDSLDAPVEVLSAADVPMPYNHRLELMAQPSAENIVEAVKKTLYI